MKKGLQIALLIVGVLVLIALILNLVNGGIWVIEGLNGKDGANGKDGINGIDGINGADGEDGVDGEDGENGKSAYELALEDGFDGTLHEWLLSLAVRGSDGEDGMPGPAGVGVKDVTVTPEGHLMVTLTNGRVLDAGKLEVGSGNNGTLSDTPDADGFYEVYETVIMTGGPSNYSTLTLRESPGSGAEIGYANKGDEVLRVGDQRTDDGYSRLVYNGKICYAKSKYFEVKYTYDGDMPVLNLPESMILTEGVQTWFMTDQILPDRTADTKVSYSYSGKGERVFDGCDAFAITPAWKTEATGTHAPESATLTVKVEKRVDGDLHTILEETVEIVIVDAQPTLSLTGLIIGDSRISDGTLVTDLANAMPNLELIGTRKVSYSGVKHEGRGAWSTSHYLKNETLEVAEGVFVPNAFYNASTQSFDFTYYMEQNYPDTELDFVVINLGANDAFSKESVDRINTMIASIHSYAKDIRVIVMTEYLSPSDGYYLSQSSNLDVDAMRARQFRYFAYLTEKFEGREGENIYLLPNYLSINGWSDWQRATVSTSDGEALRITDVIHLGSAGYKKEAATLRAYLYWLFGVQA